jgi:hypothetical protein
VRHFTHGLLLFLVRLACVRHAACVDSEPGSKSRLKPRLSCHPDGGRSGSTTPAQSLLRAYYLPCENDQAKPDRLSRLARSTLLSKILMADRLSGAAWIEARTVTSGLSSNLLRDANFTLYSGHGHFCANLLNLSKFRCHVKLRFRGNQGYNYTSTAGRFSCLFDRLQRQKFPAAEGRTAQKFQTTTSD